MMSMGRQFDVDSRAEERETDEVTIGGVVWKPIRRTNKVMGKVQAIASRSEELSKRAKAAEDAKEPIPKEVTAEFNTLLYEQIGLLIRDPQGQPPKLPVRNEKGEVTEEGFLEQHLDIRDATPVLRFLMGNDPDTPLEGEDEDEDGEGERPTSPPTTSPTPTSPASAPPSESGDGTPAPAPEPASVEAAPAEGNADEWQREEATAPTSG